MSRTLSEKLAEERRRRLGAQRLLEYKERELLAANQCLALHSRGLSDQIIQQRAVVKTRDRRSWGAKCKICKAATRRGRGRGRGGQSGEAV